MLETKIGLYLREARRRAELTQEQAAQIAGMSRQQVNRIEKGESGTEWDTVEKLVSAYKCDKAEAVRIFTDTEDSKPDVRLARQLDQYLMRLRPEKRLATEYECALATMMLASMFYAGLRPMEVIALELLDLDMEKRNLIVRHGKGRKRREVPINETLAAHILAWLPVRLRATVGAPLLVTPQHRAMSYYMLRTTFVKIKIAGGLRSAKGLTAHCLRHWFASTLYHNKTDLEVIRKLLGHSHLSSTQNYLHQMGNEMHDAVKGLDEAPTVSQPQPRPAVYRLKSRTNRR